jgi:hypothetical protein
LKTFWQQAVNNWIHNNPGQKITRLQFGKLTAAWNQAATVGNGSAGFSACGIYPQDPQKIPGHAFAITDGAVDESNSTAAVEGAVNIKEQEISFNILSTDQVSVASTSTSSAASRHTSFEDISLVPLVKRPKPTSRKKTEGPSINMSETTGDNAKKK